MGNLYDLILIHISGLEHGLEILLTVWNYLILISAFNFLSFFNDFLSLFCYLIIIHYSLLYGMEIYRYEDLSVIYWNCDEIYGLNVWRDIMKDYGIIQMSYI